MKALVDQPQCQRIAVTVSLGRLDSGDDRQDEGGEPEKEQQWNADQYEHQRDATEKIEQDRDLKIQGFPGIALHILGVLPHRQVYNERQEEAETKQDGQMAEHAPDFVSPGRCQGRIIRCRGFHIFLRELSTLPPGLSITKRHLVCSGSDRGHWGQPSGGRFPGQPQHPRFGKFEGFSEHRQIRDDDRIGRHQDTFSITHGRLRFGVGVPSRDADSDRGFRAKAARWRGPRAGARDGS